VFDADAVRLIGEAPPLEGLDLAELPQQFTNAYASIVSARIRLRELSTGTALPDELTRLVSTMRRLAFTQEALVSAVRERENRKAAAFVAGSAHHVVLMAQSLIANEPHQTRLSCQSISSEVSATLLFLIAETSADASEMANSISLNSEDHIERGLLTSIKHLAQGRLRDILEIPLASSESVLRRGGSDSATAALYLRLQHGLHSLAQVLLDESRRKDIDPATHFELVRELGVRLLPGIPGVDAQPISTYPGPVHLASLLSATTGQLAHSAIVNVPTPSGVTVEDWQRHTRQTASHRPFLWPNHIEALNTGYLEPGASAVVSFPTGAGKSTLSELKIAAALLRGHKVIFLAPTLALVDQTARALADGFPDRAVDKEPDEILSVESDKKASLPDVSVMTPERCLAMLSFDRELFAEIGLIVFDECHLLHPRDEGGGHRAINAMLCVLNLSVVCPDAEYLFLSAMMSNTAEIAKWVEKLSGRKCLALDLTWKPTRQVRGCVVYDQSRISELHALLNRGRYQSKNKSAPAALKKLLTASPYGFFCLHQTWQSKARKDYALLGLLESDIFLSAGTGNNGDWYLTPNGNQVAARLAAASARKSA